MSEIEQLDRILRSTALVTSPSLSRFLRYIVEETLAGRGSAIREYTLGVHVFDRGEDFNPRLDPIVRVQARNLRSRIAKYYETLGAGDPIRIELPKGTYVPLFRKCGVAGDAKVPDAVAGLPTAAAAPAPAPVAVPTDAATTSIMPVPPPRSPVAAPRGVERYLIAVVILLAILVGMAALFLTRMHAAPGVRVPGALAQDFYLRGRDALDHESEASLRKSAEYFRKALQEAPGYAAAHAGLADAYNIMAQFGLIHPSEAMENARSEARRAIQLEPLMAEGHVALAAVLEAYDWNWKEAEAEYRRALQLNPGLPSAHLWYGMFLRDQGRLKEALPELQLAARLQPASLLTTVNLAYGLLEQGDAAAAMEQAKRAVEMEPGAATASVLMVYSAQKLERPADAMAALDQAKKLAQDPHSLALVAC